MANRVDSKRGGVGENGTEIAPPSTPETPPSSRDATASDIIRLTIGLFRGVLNDAVPLQKAAVGFRGAEAIFRGAEYRAKYGDDLCERAGA